MNLMQGIIKKLDNYYPNIKKETRVAKQGIGNKAPCFFISIIKTDFLRQLNDYFLTDNFVSVTYISDEKDRYILEQKKFEMLVFLEQIDLGEIGVTAAEIEGKIVETDVLVTARYKIMLEKEKAKHYMETLREDIRVKDEKPKEKNLLNKNYFADNYTKGRRKQEQEERQKRIEEANKKISTKDIENLKRIKE